MDPGLAMLYLSGIVSLIASPVTLGYVSKIYARQRQIDNLINLHCRYHPEDTKLLEGK